MRTFIATLALLLLDHYGADWHPSIVLAPLMIAGIALLILQDIKELKQ